MFCGKCGSPIRDGNTFCSNCGAPIDGPVTPANDSVPQYSSQPIAPQYFSQPINQPVQTVPVYMATQSAPPVKTNGWAIAGMVLGILAICLCWIPYVGLILGFSGSILSIIGLSTFGSFRSGRGQAIAGLILSILALFMGAILTLGIMTYVNKAQKAATSVSLHESAVASVDAEIDAQLG